MKILLLITIYIYISIFQKKLWQNIAQGGRTVWLVPTTTQELWRSVGCIKKRNNRKPKRNSWSIGDLCKSWWVNKYWLLAGQGSNKTPLQGKAKKTRKFAEVKRMLNPKDMRLWVASKKTMLNNYNLYRHTWTERRTRKERRRRKRRQTNLKLTTCESFGLVWALSNCWVHHTSNQTPSAMFFSHNEALGPPYHVIVDTNFINFSIKNKIDLIQGMMDCLYAKCESQIASY